MSYGSASQQVVVTETAMTLVSDPEQPQVRAELRYGSAQPFSVKLSLSLYDVPVVEWVFARDLLMQGVRMPTGQGDIQVYPVFDGVIIELHSPDGHAELLASGPDLTAFAEAMERLVPIGREGDFYSIDDELTALLTPAGIHFGDV